MNKLQLLSNNSDDVAYVTLLTRLIDKIKVDTNQPAIDGLFASAMAQSWKTHLKDRHKIPASELESLYFSALDYRASKNIFSSFSVQDLIAAWSRKKEEMLQAASRKPYGSNFCQKCKNNNGYILAHQNGKTIEVACKHGN